MKDWSSLFSKSWDRSWWGVEMIGIFEVEAGEVLGLESAATCESFDFGLTEPWGWVLGLGSSWQRCAISRLMLREEVRKRDWRLEHFETQIDSRRSNSRDLFEERRWYIISLLTRSIWSSCSLHVIAKAILRRDSWRNVITHHLWQGLLESQVIWLLLQ